MDVACGDNHSVALNNQKEVFLWGSNQQAQCGFDPEFYGVIHQPKKLALSEYMNSSQRESFSTIKAKANYTVLLSESKHVSQKIVAYFPV